VVREEERETKRK